MAAYALPLPSDPYNPAQALADPQPIGPWADIQAAKAAGQPPYVVRCSVTGAIYDRILNRVFKSSVEYARVHGHQQHSQPAPTKRACMREWAVLRPPCPAAPKRTVGTRRVSKEQITSAFTRFRSGEAGAESELLQLVLDFGRSRAYSNLYDRAESYLTPDDVAQELAQYVWGKLPTFDGTPASFYSLVNRVRFTETSAAEIEAGNVEKRVPMSITAPDGEQYDNIELHGPVFKHNGRLRNHAAGYAFTREIPASIQGVDRAICEFIRDGRDYAEIGSLLGITKAAVELRVRRMRDAETAKD